MSWLDDDWQDEMWERQRTKREEMQHGVEDILPIADIQERTPTVEKIVFASRKEEIEHIIKFLEENGYEKKRINK